MVAYYKINVLYSVEWGSELACNMNELMHCRYKWKQVENCNSDKVPIRFPLFLLLVMLKIFDTTFDHKYSPPVSEDD